MIRERKVQLKVYVSRQVNEDLRKLIAQKYGRYERGLLSMEVEKALNQWIRAHAKSTHGSFTASMSNAMYKIKIKYKKVEDYLKRKYNTPALFTASLRDLEEAIAMTIGSDPRTIKKYLTLFEEFHLIRNLGGEKYELA